MNDAKDKEVHIFKGREFHNLRPAQRTLGLLNTGSRQRGMQLISCPSIIGMKIRIKVKISCINVWKETVIVAMYNICLTGKYKGRKWREYVAP